MNIKSRLKTSSVALLMVAVVSLLIIPLPTAILDFMFILNITISLVILFITMYIKETLEFAIFPSLLLVTTVYRLSLNISSTRSILTNAGYAGEVVKTFGEFVIQGNIVVGLIIFIILVLVQFIVITKGAERVAEVSARFTLDALPGKQMAIDADLSSGLITEEQANAVLDMRLSKLTKLDKDDLIKELEEVRLAIVKFEKIINDQSFRDIELKEKVNDLKNKYGDARRTVISQIEDSPKEKEIKFVEPEKCVVVMTESGLIKRIPATSFRTQRRNGKGVKAQDDITHAVIRTNTIDSLMIFSNKGKLYRLLVNDIPVGTNVSKGQYIKSLITMAPDEEPAVIYSIYRDTDAKYVLFTTKNGLVKKTTLDEYVKTKKKTGLAAINIKEGDELASVSLIKDEHIIVITENGMAIRFKSEDIGATSRATAGIKGISLGKDDKVLTAIPVRNNTDKLAIFSHNGLGKKIDLSELPVQNRAGKGLACYKPTNSTGKVVAATLVEDADSILVMGEKSNICIDAKEIPALGRASIGNNIIKDNKIVSVSKV